MSKELIGSNREVVGNPAYLEKLHNAHFDGTLRCSRGDEFARSMESLAGNRFCHLFSPNPDRLVRELERDLEQGLRDNDYIRDENADNLRTALKQLERCGVRCYSLERKIDDLAWFVGGDPDKIRKLQQALNELGAGEKLEEDGVYGEKTKTAADTFIADASKFLADTEKVQQLARVVDLMTIALDFSTGRSQLWKMRSVLQGSCRELERTVWKLGPEYYLRPRGYDVAALLLEHSIEHSPSNLSFFESHWVTQKIMQSNGFREFYRTLESRIRQDIDAQTASGEDSIDFGESGDTDLYLGIGSCSIFYVWKRDLKSVHVEFLVYDRYDFDSLRSVKGDVEHMIKFDFNIGNLANDAGLFSQADGGISKYSIFAKFRKTIRL